MGLEKDKSRRQFGPQDLGILDSPPSRSTRAVVDLCAAALGAPSAMLCIFDDSASELFLNTSVGLVQKPDTGIGLPLTGSLAYSVRSASRILRINDLRVAPYDTSVEHLRFGAKSYVGGIVRGPADEPIGVLAAMHPTPYNWTFHDIKLIGDLTYMLSQQIMLKASFETLKIMSAERRASNN